MTVDTIKFELLEDSPAPEWTILVTATGSGFEPRAALLHASVGDQSIEGIIASDDGTAFNGYLREEPPMGAALVVGFEDPVDTGLTFEGLT